MTFAVIKTGGKQYKVAANDTLKIEKLDAEPGTIVTFDQVLMVGDLIGFPLVEGALVAAELLETRKQKTVIIFKKNRRHNYRRRNGHRQLLSTVRITEILTGGAQPTIKATPVDTSNDIVVAPKLTRAQKIAANQAETPVVETAAVQETAPVSAAPAMAAAAAEPAATAETPEATPAPAPKKAAAKKASAVETETTAEQPAKKASAKKAEPAADKE